MPKRFPALLLAALVVVVPARITAVEPANLDPHKQEITRYIESGEYRAKVAEVALKATKYVAKRSARAKPGEKLAIVFDIDETTLSNMAVMQSNGFGYNPKLWKEWITARQATAIVPVQAVYENALRHEVAVFFVTSRLESQRAATEKNLRTVGYEVWAGTFFRADADEQPTRQYKGGARRQIESAGYTIIANIGDQDSDLAGGHAEKTFKLPNPFYKVY
jgi:predicted secreted acid phosphatase